MSLDVTVKYKTPVRERYNEVHAACGSTVRLCVDDEAEYVDYWSANITHNMGEMASHVKVSYTIDGEEYSDTLYQWVWRPEEVHDGKYCNTTVVGQALQSGIAYMVLHREELEVFNPKNGWGSYDAFLNWLKAYWETCLKHPDCEIEVSR